MNDPWKRKVPTLAVSMTCLSCIVDIAKEGVLFCVEHSTVGSAELLEKNLDVVINASKGIQTCIRANFEAKYQKFFTQFEGDSLLTCKS